MKNAPLSDQSDSTDFYLRRFNDPCDIFRDIRQVWKDWSPSEWFKWTERYKKGDLEIVLRLHPLGDGEVTDLVFFAIPSMGENFTFGRKFVNCNVCVGTLQTDTGQKSVLADVTELVDDPNGIRIPSFVRLEPAKERQDVRRQILALSAANYVRFQLGSGVGDGKVTLLGVTLAPKDSGSVGEMVERRAQVFDYFHDKEIKMRGSMTRQAAFVDFVQTVRIKFFEEDLRVTVGKSAGLFYQRIEQFLCATDAQFCAEKGV